MGADPEEHRCGLTTRHLGDGEPGPELETEPAEQPSTKSEQLGTEARQREIVDVDGREIGVAIGVGRRGRHKFVEFRNGECAPPAVGIVSEFSPQPVRRHRHEATRHSKAGSRLVE